MENYSALNKKTAANKVFLLAGRKFLSSRFSLVVQFVIFTKTCYKKSPPTEIPKRCAQYFTKYVINSWKN